MRTAAALLAITSLTFLAAAGFSARLAVLHMARLGEICGGSSLAAHCVWCPATAALAAAGLLAAALAAQQASTTGLAKAFGRR
jgi:hypothetical protein